MTGSASIFRRAEFTDGIFLANCLRQFYREHEQLHHIPYNHESCLEAVSDILRRGLCVVGPASCAGAYLVSWPFNKSALIAQVFFWWFGARRELGVFDALVNLCRDNGATHVNVASLAPAFAGASFYRKRGLKVIERHFLGQLKSLQGEG